MSDKIVDFSDYKETDENVKKAFLYREMYYELARAVETAIKCATKRESDKLLVNAQRLAEYKLLSYYDKDIESIEIFMAGFNVDEYLDNLYQNNND